MAFSEGFRSQDVAIVGPLKVYLVWQADLKLVQQVRGEEEQEDIGHALTWTSTYSLAKRHKVIRNVQRAAIVLEKPLKRK